MKGNLTRRVPGVGLLASMATGANVCGAPWLRSRIWPGTRDNQGSLASPVPSREA